MSGAPSLLNSQISMLMHILTFPGEHRHGRDLGADIKRDVKQISVDFAAVKHAIKKCLLVRGKIEQESKSLPAEHDRLLDPRIDHVFATEIAARQADQDVVARTQVVLVIGCSTSDLDT